jgi:hypothetical protein
LREGQLSELRSAGVTAFDVFGILLPGVLLVAALRILIVPLHGPISLAVDGLGLATWVSLGFVCYIAGHFAQLVGRVISRVSTLFIPWGEVFRLSVDRARQPETAHALQTIRDRLQHRTGLHLSGLSDVVLSNLTDEFLEQYGKSSTLANFRSREVYYRGLSSAMLVLGMAFAVSAVQHVVVFEGASMDQITYANWLLSAACIATSVAAADAYRRQRRRRMRHSLLGYLILETGGRLQNLKRLYERDLAEPND